MQILGFDLPVASFAIVAATFLAFAALEMVVPFRRASQPGPRRRLTNLSLFAIDTLAVRVVVPGAMIGMAALAGERDWGLFNRADLPAWIEIALTIVLLDLALYVQHRATHTVPLLWRLHRVHHVDRDFDVTTAARFHPFEIVLSMLYKVALVVALGAPVWGVFLFEVLFNCATLFNHSNIRLPARLEGPVRALLVTPDMHRIHHSALMPETNSNYSTLLSLWDRVFATYVARAQAPQRSMTIGLDSWQDDNPRKLGWSLWLPFLPNRPGGD